MNQPAALQKLPLDKISKLNDSIALRSNQIFATMGFFWFCLIFSLVPLRWPDTMAFVQYASSGVLQLVALPLLGVGTILAARASDKLGKEQHDAVMETVQNMHTLMAEIHQLHVELHAKLGDTRGKALRFRGVKGQGLCPWTPPGQGALDHH